VLIAAMLKIQPIPADVSAGPWSGLLATSANAFKTGMSFDDFCGVPAFVVGAHTAEAAKRAGIDRVVSADGDVWALVRLVKDRFRGSAARLIYLAGEQTTFDLAGTLGREGLEVHEVPVYRAVASCGFPPEVETAIREVRLDGVLHYSGRSAETYLACAAAAGLTELCTKPVHFCLSAQIARVLNEAGATDVRAPSRPDETSLLALIG
jgi:uroporphyrinogen-III synthase